MTRRLTKGPDVSPLEPVIGLIPAAGYSRRLAPIACSKEIYPIGYRTLPGGGVRPRPVCHYLLEKMQLAGVRQVYWVIRKGKWDIPDYLGDGSDLGLDLAYCVMESSPGPVFTLDQAWPFVAQATVAFGFPDIIFNTQDAFRQLLDRRRATGADVVLGLFTIDPRVRDDRVIVDSRGRVTDFLLGRAGRRYPITWNIAVWGPAFTRFMHEHVAGLRRQASRARRGGPAAQPPEMTVGQLIEAAFRAGLSMDGVLFADDSWTDIGTPEGMRVALQKFGKVTGRVKR